MPSLLIIGINASHIQAGVVSGRLKSSEIIIWQGNYKCGKEECEGGENRASVFEIPL
jgi:hypothetical protein